MDSAVKARVRMWIRSERALGLDSARIGSQKEEQEAATVAPAEPASPRPVQGKSLFIAETFAGAALSTEDKRRRFQQMDDDEVKKCTKCRLCETRTHTVFGEGDVDAQIVFIGEGPGETEDQTGRPFVGRAGNLLDKMIAGMGLKREQVYIANVVKCRPPGNRAPLPDETEACTPFLERQIETIRPKVIVTLGLPATKYILKLDLSMGRMRGQWHAWRGIKVMPTYHPSYVLRSYTQQVRAAVWSDLQMVMAELGLAAPKR